MLHHFVWTIHFVPTKNQFGYNILDSLEFVPITVQEAYEQCIAIVQMEYH